MAIKKPIPITFNLDSHNSVQSVCAVIHIDDNNTETLDLSLMQGGEHIAVSHNSTVTARFVRVKDKILISDNVPCAVQRNGNLYIPIDNAAAHMLVGEIKIEVNIVDENDVLTMQFPLVIKVNNTILADAEISPESEGTIPELLEEAREAAESATQAVEAATEAISAKQDKLTAGENITISDDNVISASGVSSYGDLTNKPRVFGANSSGEVMNLSIRNKLNFQPREFMVGGDVDGEIYVYISHLYSKFHQEPLGYDFNAIRSAPYNGYLQFDEDNMGVISNFPSALNKIDRAKTFLIYQAFNTLELGNSKRTLFRKVIGRSTSGDYLEYAQLCYVDFYAGRIISQTDWVELTGGGSQIVSGVVNVNGTIAFTDSKGDSFTTSGESVIGADGFSPSATVQQTASGATITVTDKNGTTTANITNGQDGNDYVLTAQDKDDIADIVLSELPTTQGVLYGNQSN